jgi:hypothetical protein
MEKHLAADLPLDESVRLILYPKGFIPLHKERMGKSDEDVICVNLVNL